jgi:DNA-directed RNA polymerase subunit alpha
MKVSLTIDLQEVDQAGIQSVLTLVQAIESLAKTIEPKVKDQAFRNWPISDLWFTIRTQKCLDAENIETIGDLLQWSELKLMKTPNLGSKSIGEIKSALAQRGLALAES